MTTYRQRIITGTARRWIKRNLWRLLYAGGWATLGIVIREAVAATRPEHWVMGSEMFPMAVCFILAVRVALGEKNPDRRADRGKGKER